eukprot:UC1_evm1s169
MSRSPGSASSSGDEIGEAEENWGQTVVLSRRIKGILRGYPEGIAVLKELVQNADDAGASVVKVLYDQRQHDASDTSQLLYPGLAEFQGPAIVCFNDALFTEDDFVSITRIGDSGKAGKRSKVGKFGVGFNSVYHLTDLPSFVSGDHLVLFDPHLRHLRTEYGGCEPG